MVTLAVSTHRCSYPDCSLASMRVLTLSFKGPSNCTDFVANNPSNFTNAYWEVGTFQVYTAS